MFTYSSISTEQKIFLFFRTSNFQQARNARSRGSLTIFTFSIYLNGETLDKGIIIVYFMLQLSFFLFLSIFVSFLLALFSIYSFSVFTLVRHMLDPQKVTQIRIRRLVTRERKYVRGWRTVPRAATISFSFRVRTWSIEKNQLHTWYRSVILWA